MSSKRIKETIRKSNFFQIQKERIRTIEECIIQLEYLNDEVMINTELANINARLDSIEANLITLNNKADTAQTMLSNLSDQIDALDVRVTALENP